MMEVPCPVASARPHPRLRLRVLRPALCSQHCLACRHRSKGNSSNIILLQRLWMTFSQRTPQCWRHWRRRIKKKKHTTVVVVAALVLELVLDRRFQMDKGTPSWQVEAVMRRYHTVMQAVVTALLRHPPLMIPQR